MTIAIRDVRWSAGRRMVIDGVTLDAKPGRMLGLIGPNGSGKSSLLRAICGLRRVDAGVVTIGGCPIKSHSRQRLAQRLALVEQQVATEAPVTVLDVVRLGRVPHRGPLASWSKDDDTAVTTALLHVGMETRRDQLWQSLSGGEKQRTQIARALAQSPQELLLDEPTNHLDIRHQLDLLGRLSQLPITVIVAIHDLNLAARFCQELVLLKEGGVISAGNPETVLTRENIQSVFGVEAIVEPAHLHEGLRISYLGGFREPVSS